MTNNGGVRDAQSAIYLPAPPTTTKCTLLSGGSRIFERGVVLQAAEGSRTELRSADQSARSTENFSPLFFSYQGGLS